MMTTAYTPPAPSSVQHDVALSEFLNLKLTVTTTQQVIASILAAVSKRERLRITYLNPNYVAAARRDPRLAEIINNDFDLILPDSIGVVMGARFLGLHVSERLGTNTICLELFQHCSQRRIALRTFLLGSRPGIAKRAAENVHTAFASVTVVGYHHGWFGDEENDDLVEKINSTDPELLLVCMGTPRQQFWVKRNVERLMCPVIMTGGAYLDCLAVSATRYYPPWVDRAKLNWLYRLCTEPRHVWKRYTLEAALFCGWVFAHRLKHRVLGSRGSAKSLRASKLHQSAKARNAETSHESS